MNVHLYVTAAAVFFFLFVVDGSAMPVVCAYGPLRDLICNATDIRFAIRAALAYAVGDDPNEFWENRRGPYEANTDVSGWPRAVVARGGSNGNVYRSMMVSLCLKLSFLRLSKTFSLSIYGRISSRSYPTLRVTSPWTASALGRTRRTRRRRRRTSRPRLRRAPPPLSARPRRRCCHHHHHHHLCSCRRNSRRKEVGRWPSPFLGDWRSASSPPPPSRTATDLNLPVELG